MEFKDIDKTISDVVQAKFDTDSLRADTDVLVDALSQILNDAHLPLPMFTILASNLKTRIPEQDKLINWCKCIQGVVFEVVRVGKATEAMAAYAAFVG